MMTLSSVLFDTSRTNIDYSKLNATQKQQGHSDEGKMKSINLNTHYFFKRFNHVHRLSSIHFGKGNTLFSRETHVQQIEIRSENHIIFNTQKEKTHHVENFSTS